MNEQALPLDAQEIRRLEEAREQKKREWRVIAVFWAALSAGIAALLLFAWSGSVAATAGTFGLGLLIAGAAALVGALLGFLFGLPRGPADMPRLQEPAATGGANGAPAAAGTATAAVAERTAGKGPVNTNLVEISDWLTKIIVGAGLVGLKDLVAWLGMLGTSIGGGVGLTGAKAAVFGGALVTFFFAWGFLFVYIQTRTIISSIFASMDRSLAGFASTIGAAVADEVRKKVKPELDRLSAVKAGS